MHLDGTDCRSCLHGDSKGSGYHEACVRHRCGRMSVKFAIVDETGTIIERWSIPTNLADAGSHIPDEMISSINEKLASSPELSSLSVQVFPVR